MNFKRNGNRQVFSFTEEKDAIEEVGHHHQQEEEQQQQQHDEQDIAHQDNDINVTSGGKLELSLVNFQLQNPHWNPNHESLQRDFLDFVKRGATSSVDDMTASVFSRERSRLLSSSIISRRVVNVNEEEEEDRNLEMTLSTLFLHEVQQQQQQPRNTPSVTRND